MQFMLDDYDFGIVLAKLVFEQRYTCLCWSIWQKYQYQKHNHLLCDHKHQNNLILEIDHQITLGNKHVEQFFIKYYWEQLYSVARFGYQFLSK